MAADLLETVHRLSHPAGPDRRIPGTGPMARAVQGFVKDLPGDPRGALRAALRMGTDRQAVGPEPIVLVTDRQDWRSLARRDGRIERPSWRFAYAEAIVADGVIEIQGPCRVTRDLAEVGAAIDGRRWACFDRRRLLTLTRRAGAVLVPSMGLCLRSVAIAMGDPRPRDFADLAAQIGSAGGMAALRPEALTTIVADILTSYLRRQAALLDDAVEDDFSVLDGCLGDTEFGRDVATYARAFPRDAAAAFHAAQAVVEPSPPASRSRHDDLRIEGNLRFTDGAWTIRGSTAQGRAVTLPLRGGDHLTVFNLSCAVIWHGVVEPSQCTDPDDAWALHRAVLIRGHGPGRPARMAPAERRRLVRQMVGQALGPEADRWLAQPHDALGGKAPAAILNDPAGLAQVERLVATLTAA